MHRTLAGFAFAFLLVLAGTSHAQMGGSKLKDALANSTPGERARFQTDMMKEKLALTPDQVPKVEAINLKSADAMEPVIKSSDGPVVKLKHAREIEEQKANQLKGVLTGEQFSKYLVMRDEMKQKLEEKLANKAAGGTP